MEDGLNFLQTFNPIESKPELLEKTLAGRRELVDRLEELAIDSATSGNKHQRLIIGPRGSGKTHLLRVLYNRISSRPELEGKLRIAYLCEDEYGIAGFLDLIIRIFRSFIRWDRENAAYLSDEMDKLKKVPANDQEKVAISILMRHIEDRTLIIIVENIENIFVGIQKEGQAKLRDFIQQHPVVSLIASNQALFNDVRREDKPFHNFFKITHLKRLTLEEAILFLKSIAKWEKREGLLDFLDKPEGRGRVKAVYDITSGNHRLLVTFYNFVKTDYKKDLAVSFIKTINNLIPYYQSFMNLLSAQQQKVVQYLCQTRIPCNVKDIAENTFTSPGSISKQMSSLVKLRYVDPQPSGKETFYELAEPLLRICFEVKENRGGPVKLFIDFLGNLYSAEEIKQKYMYFHVLSKVSPGKASQDYFQEQLYYKEALKYYPENFKDFNIEEFEKEERDLQVKFYIEELEKSGAYSQLLDFSKHIIQKDRFLLLKEASAYEELGDVKKTIETAEALLAKDENDIDALILLSGALRKSEEYEKSNSYLAKVIKIDECNIKALIGIGANLIILGKYEDAEVYLLKATDLDRNAREIFLALGIIMETSDVPNQAEQCISKYTELKPESSDGWKIFGDIKRKTKKFEDAEYYYLKAIEINNKNASAFLALGQLMIQQGKYQQVEKYLKKYTKLEPKSFEGWILLGIAKAELNKPEEAETCILEAIELDNENAEAIYFLAELLGDQKKFQQAEKHLKKYIELRPKSSDGWLLLGIIEHKQNNIKDAQTNYLKALELEKNNWDAVRGVSYIMLEKEDFENAKIFIDKLPKNSPGKPELLYILGEGYRENNLFEEALPFFRQAIDLDPKEDWPYFNIVTCYLGLNDPSKALTEIENVLNVIQTTGSTDIIIQAFEENLTTLFIHGSNETITTYLTGSLPIFEKYNYLEQYHACFPQVVFNLLARHEDIETDRFEMVETVLKESFKETPALIVPLKFLNIGIRHLKKKEKNALLKFTKEERAIFHKFVLEKIEK